MRSNSDKLLEFLTAIADGRRPDIASLDAAARTDEERELVHKVGLIAAVQAAHRQGRGAGRDASRVRSPDQQNTGATSLEAPQSAQRPTDGVSKRWGKLELFERVGEGEFGEVFRAFDPVLEQDIALKLLWPPTQSVAADRKRALREVRALAAVHHPNVVAIYGIESHGGRQGIRLEFIRGLTLAQLLQVQGRFSAWEASLIGLQLCDALAAVHEAGVLHCDVKAHNVMREEGGRIILMDFGAARPIGGPERSLGGTPLYIAPEVLQGESASAQADVYSLGVMLFKLVTDTYPHHGDSIEDIRRSHQEHGATRAIDLRSDLPDRFSDILERALSREPKARFRTIHEFRSSLQHSLPAASRHDHVSAATASLPSFTSTRPTGRISIFISYCHEDAPAIEKLGIIPYLRELENDGCDVWSDHNLGTGDDWRRVLTDRLLRSDVLVPLVTQPYLRSHYCRDVEVKSFWDRRTSEGVVIFPIMVAPSNWQSVEWLSTTQFSPRTGTMLKMRRVRRDELMIGAIQELRSIVSRLRAART
jgi:serine/threonine protein kinase